MYYKMDKSTFLFLILYLTLMTGFNKSGGAFCLGFFQDQEGIPNKNLTSTKDNVKHTINFNRTTSSHDSSTEENFTSVYGKFNFQFIKFC